MSRSAATRKKHIYERNSSFVIVAQVRKKGKEIMGAKNEFFDKAAAKLAEKVHGKREALMEESVREALMSFCRQDAEFAQAVAQGGDFSACMTAVAKGVGECIPDIEAYRRAVQFYFKGAEVRFCMELILCPGEATDCVSTQKKMLDLADFL